MIKRIYDPLEIKKRLSKDVYSLKIKSLLFCYGTVYDFCAFYIQNGNVFAGYYNEYIFTCPLNSEAKEFLNAAGAKAVFAPGQDNDTVIMTVRRNEGKRHQTDKRLKINADPKPDKVYQIFREAFREFSEDFEGWYVDISHRVRHGQCRLYTIGDENSGDALGALSLGFIFPEAVFISALGVLPRGQRKGLGSALLCAVLEQYKDRDVYTVCSRKNTGFYEYNGFLRSGFRDSFSKK